MLPNEQLHVGPDWDHSGPTCVAHVGYHAFTTSHAFTTGIQLGSSLI